MSDFNVLVAGKSGAGKQPRIDALVDMYGLSQLSTGNIFRFYLKLLDGIAGLPSREAIWDSAENWFIADEKIAAMIKPLLAGRDVTIDDAVLALKVQYFVLQGLFVPDQITNALFYAAFAKKGFKGCVLDGYPRTVQQCDFLLETVQKAGTEIAFILLVDAEDDNIVQRLTGRRICSDPNCAKVYHLQYNPPKDGRYCTVCGAEVLQRGDDTEEKILKRLQEFRDKAKPAVDYLVAKGLKLAVVPGNLPKFSPEAVLASVKEGIAKAGINI